MGVSVFTLVFSTAHLSCFTLKRGRCAMIIIESYRVVYDAAASAYRIENSSAPICPGCGGLLSGYDHRKRTVIGLDSKKRSFILRRLKCPVCKTIHLELPDLMLPRKHYAAAVIRNAKNGSAGDCPADDSTIHRWRK